MTCNQERDFCEALAAAMSNGKPDLDKWHLEPMEDGKEFTRYHTLYQVEAPYYDAKVDRWIQHYPAFYINFDKNGKMEVCGKYVGVKDYFDACPRIGVGSAKGPVAAGNDIERRFLPAYIESLVAAQAKLANRLKLNEEALARTRKLIEQSTMFGLETKFTEGGEWVDRDPSTMEPGDYRRDYVTYPIGTEPAKSEYEGYIGAGSRQVSITAGSITFEASCVSPETAAAALAILNGKIVLVPMGAGIVMVSTENSTEQIVLAGQ